MRRDADRTEPAPPARQQPALDLDAPGTYRFTISDARRGRHINRFAGTLRDAECRRAFAADEEGVLASSGLSPDVVAMIRTRDWTGLMQAGGHLQVMLFIAATVGLSLWDIGAHNVGCEPADLIRSCPRQVAGLPLQMVDTPWQG